MDVFRTLARWQAAPVLVRHWVCCIPTSKLRSGLVLASALLAASASFVSEPSLARTPHPNAAAVSFACSKITCGMPPQGAFEHLIVGRVVAVANADQTQALFNAMRSNGHWSVLPPHGDLFWENLQPIAIDTGGDAVFITFSSQDEMHSAPVRIGDYVRYSPHIGRYETPPSDKLAAMYWGIDGCVAVLCRASDRKCVKHYASGVYRTSDGRQLSLTSLLPLKHGVVIDTETMVPTRTRQ